MQEHSDLDSVLTLSHQLNSIIAAISKTYWVIYHMDLIAGTFEKVSAGDESISITGNTGHIKKSFDILLQKFIDKKSYDNMSSFVDISTLDERMKGKTAITQEYLSSTGRWYEASIIEEERDAAGKLLKTLYVAKDISERKQKEVEIQKQKEENYAIINALAKNYLNVYLVDKNNNTIKILKLEGYVTTGLEKESQQIYSYEAVYRQYVSERVYTDDREMMYNALSLSTIVDRLKDNNEYVGTYRIFKNEEIHYYQFKYTPLDNTEYIIAGFQNIDEMIKEQQKQQHMLTVALAAAEQSSRAKTVFLNSMSHDIRTPMNAIIGFTALAQTHIDNKELVQDYLAKITTSSSHLLSLINDILDMSRIESGSVKLEESCVHMPDVLHDLRTIIQGQIIAKQQNLYIDTQDVVHEDVITDKLRLNQILLNIVSNAIKFTPTGGNIIIRVIEKPCYSNTHTTFEFSIKDTGIGISKEFLTHVFDSFSREQSATVSGIQGTGLGMAITKNIVNMMGGSIRVISEEGHGSEFIVTLDLRLSDHPVVYEPIEELRGVRALVVDDDVNTCRNVCKMLREIDMRPDWTISGKEAVIRAQDAFEMKDEYKAYIIDYLMPDMNGIETVRRIRRVVGDNIPIIILTAYDWADIEKEAREAGVTAFVAKPIFMSELRTVLTKPVAQDCETPPKKTQHLDYSGKHILLVEDNELNREIATAILEESGFTVDGVCDGIDAVDTMHSCDADTYDLILMDVQMPKMDGYTATKEIRTLSNNKKANIPIIAMTANAFEEDRQKALEAGMNGHVAKPIDVEKMLNLFDEIFR